MSNFNFAFFFSLYVAANGWVYLNKPRHFLLLSIVLTLPLLFLAVSSLGSKKEPDAPGDGSDSPSTSTQPPSVSLAHFQESLLPTISAIVVTAVFLFFVYTKYDTNIFFFLPRLQGWDYIDGLQMLIFGTAMGACGIGIWASGPASKLKAGAPGVSDFNRRVFLLSTTSGLRLIVLFAILLLSWSAGTAAVIAIHRGAQWSDWLIVSGRATVPLVLLILSSFLRVPLPAGALLAAAGSWGLLYLNFGKIPETAVFIAAQLAILIIYSYIMNRARFGAAATPPKPHAQETRDATGNDKQ